MRRVSIHDGVDAVESRLKFFDEVCELLRQGSLSRYQHIVATSSSANRRDSPYGLSKPPASAIALDRVTNLFGHRESKSGTRNPLTIDVPAALGLSTEVRWA